MSHPANTAAVAGNARTVALFAVNGLVATAVHYGTLVFLLEVAGVPLAGVANGFASLVGIAASFLGNRLMVFKSKRPATATLPRFVALYAALALCHTAILALWSDGLGLPYSWGFLLSTGVTTVLSYIGNRYFVFPVSALPATQP